MANKIPTSTINPLSYVKNVPNSIVIEDVSEQEVYDIIKSLSNSSAGWDEFPLSIAKQCSKNFVKPLTALINSSFRERVFPRELKKARVVPIYKTGDKPLINNYRPISILSFYSKVFEKLMYNKLYNFIEANDILYAHQYGFRRGHSTQQAIITLINKITKSVNSDDVVISVFIDLKKGFDCVPTNILLAKLQAYGIRGDYIKWFRSYLTDRIHSMLTLMVKNLPNILSNVVSPKDQSLVLYFLLSLLMTCLMIPMFCLMCFMQMILVYI